MYNGNTGSVLGINDLVIKNGLLEPRCHEGMSGFILYPPTRNDCDAETLFIEVSGWLPMCGHGKTGTLTDAIEEGLVIPKKPRTLRLDTPAGLVEVEYIQSGSVWMRSEL